jgi:hypothetical protein
MFQVFIRTITLLTGTFILVIAWMIVLAPIETDPLLELIPDPDCSMPCFLGITPGVTFPDEALISLQNHPWIENVREREDIIGWSWSDQAPEALHSASSSYLEHYNGVVFRIHVFTTLPLNTAWEVLQDHFPPFIPDSMMAELRPGVYLLYTQEADVPIAFTLAHPDDRSVGVMY